MKWQRIVPFDSKKKQRETWICQYNNHKKEFSVEVSLGKEIDILSLKAGIVEELVKKVEHTRISRVSTYQSMDNLERVNLCPICECSSDTSKKILNIYGATYFRCNECTHYYLLYRPKDEYLKRFYKTNKEYQSTYADKKTLQTRVEQVVIPKARYVLGQYKKRYGRLPKAILDVGAGSGHFVYACRKLGVPCEGVEISEFGRNFCKKNFDFELLDLDFLEDAERFNCDIVALWGLIEHVASPVEMLKSSKLALSKEGMIVTEVPRWDSFSTAVHTAFPESVIRHLDPMDHIQCFSDSSLATAFTLSDYEVIAAWYFGMDAYELLVQLSYVLNKNKIIKTMGKNIPIFQERLDLAKLSDFMVFVGVPSDLRDGPV